MALTNIVTNMDLDVYDHNLTPTTIKSIAMDDNTRYVAAAVLWERNPYDIGQSAGVILTVLRPDNTGVQVTGSTYSYDADGTTMYGAYAELTQLAIAIKGTCKGQFKITSGEQILRTEIFYINNGQALDADIESWAGNVDGHNLDEMAESIETLETAVGTLQTDVATVKEDLKAFNAADIFLDNATLSNLTDGAGNSYAWNGSTVTISRSSASTAAGVGAWLLGNNSGIPDCLAKGKTYQIKFARTSEYIRLQIFYKTVSNGTSTLETWVDGDMGFTVPSDCTSIGFRLRVLVGFSGSASATITLLTAIENEGIGYAVKKNADITWTTDKYIGDRGLDADSTSYEASDYIPVKAGMQITVINAAATTSKLQVVHYYNKLKTKIGDESLSSGSAGQNVGHATYTVPSGAHYVRISRQKAINNATRIVYGEYMPVANIEPVTDVITNGDDFALEIPIVFTAIAGKYVDTNGDAGNSDSWANSGYAPIVDGCDYIKIVNGSAALNCYALFFDASYNIVGLDIGNASGEFSAERIIQVPSNAVYIRCNFLATNTSTFAIYALFTRLADKSMMSFKAYNSVMVNTGNRLNTIFRQTKANGSLFTITDDDTTSLLNVQRFHDICANSGIRGCYAVITQNLTSDSSITAALLNYEKEGFQNVLHCNEQLNYFLPANRNIASVRSNIATAIQKMTSYGFSDFKHWIAPYGALDQELKDMARDFGFDSAFLVAQTTYCKYAPHPKYSRFSIPRMELYPTDEGSATGNTLTEIKAQMLDCANNGGWFHLCTHLYQWGDDLSRITEVLEYANTLGMKNVTISGGLSYWLDIYRMYDLF